MVGPVSPTRVIGVLARPRCDLAGKASPQNGNVNARVLASLNPLGEVVLGTAAVPEMPAPVPNRLVAAYLDVQEASRIRYSAADGSVPAPLWSMVIIAGSG